MCLQVCWELCPGGWERWGEDHRSWWGALEAEEEGVDDLCVSVLATWELCLPATDRKRNFWKYIQGKVRLLGNGSIRDSGLGRRREKEGVCAYKDLGRCRKGKGLVRDSF